MNKKRKITLGVLPFWPPLIPPLGIASIKGFIEKYGYHVNIFDANTMNIFKNYQDEFFEKIEELVPPQNRGNLRNIGMDVLTNHLMACVNSGKPDFYLIELIYYNAFYINISDGDLKIIHNILNNLLKTFKEYMMSVLSKEEPDVFGLSVYRHTLPLSIYAFKIAKELNSNIINVMGGQVFSGEFSLGSSNFDYFVENTNYIDHIFIGEGELLLLNFLEGNLVLKKVYTFEDIKNNILNLNLLESLDYGNITIDNYLYMPTFISRSCPYQCKFCSETKIWGKYRKRTIAKLLQDVKSLSENYKSKLFLMTDSLLNPVIQELSEELMKYSNSIYYDGYLKIDNLSQYIENTLSWRNSGFYRARLGVESGSLKILKMMGKNLTIDQIKKALYNLSTVGIKTTTYWIVGYPGETDDDFKETLRLLEEMKDFIYEAECNPLRYYKQMEGFDDELLYPSEMKKLLLSDFYELINVIPTREKKYERVGIFEKHCNQLGIPNVYSAKDLKDADHRWKQLHENSVPTIYELNDINFIAKSNIILKSTVSATIEDVKDFDF